MAQQLEEGQEGSAAASKLKAAASGGMGLCKRTVSTLANALNFTMGMAWLSVARLLVSGGCCVSASSQEAPGAWLAFWFGAVVLVPLGVCLTKRRLTLGRRAEAAADRGDVEEARDYQSTSMTYQTVVSWGVAFTLVGQLANATSATLPATPWAWKALYALLLFVLVLVFAFLIFSLGARLAGRAAESVADSLVSGTAYTLALAFLDVVVAAFRLEDRHASPELGYLAVFAGATWAFVAVALWALARLDRAEVFKAAEEVKKEAASQLGAQAALARRFFRANLRKLLGKSVSMCGVAAAYALFSAWISAVAGRGRAAFAAALIFFLAALAMAIAGSAVVECTAKRYGKRLRSLDLLPDSSYDDLVVAGLISLLETSSATGIESLSWLVGTALHSCALVAWVDVTTKRSPQGGEEGAFMGVFAFACLLSLLTPLVTVRLAPPPVQPAFLKMPQRPLPRPTEEPAAELIGAREEFQDVLPN